MKLTLRVWRQKNADADGAMSTYEVDGISSDMSFLEMLDTLNEELILRGRSVGTAAGLVTARRRRRTPTGSWSTRRMA